MATVFNEPLRPDVVEPEGFYEVIDGRIVEQPPMSALDAWIASRLGEALGNHARTNQLGHAVMEMLFLLDATRNLRRRADVAFVSRERWPLNRRVPRVNAWDVVPDLAIEITSPSNITDDDMQKLVEYFRAGTRAVWQFYPGQNRVYVYDSPTSVRILLAGDVLDGGTVLPGFRLPLSELLGEEPPEVA